MADIVIEVMKGHGNHRIITTGQLKKVMAVIEAAKALKPISAKYAKDDRTIYWQVCSIQYKALKDALKQLEPVSTGQTHE